MRSPGQPMISTVASAVLMLALGAASHADDTEIFISRPANDVQANILLIIDTSGSMNEAAESSLLPYDPTVSYSNSGTSCNEDRIYYSTSSTPPTSCSGLSHIRLSGNFSRTNPREMKCKRAVDALAWGTGTEASSTGFYSGTFIRWRGQGASRTWQNNLANANGSTTGGTTTSGSGTSATYATDVECLEDAGFHGADASSAAKWPRTGSVSQSDGRWTSNDGQSWWGASTGVSVTLYSPNYIRYLRNGPRETQTRMQVVKAAAASFLNSLPNLNVGVMRYSTNSHSYGSADSTAAGGMMMSPISPLNEKRAALIADITASNLYLPHGWTPLTETLFEAYRYFSGGPVSYGNNSRICTRVDSSPGSTGTCAGSNYMQNYPSVASSRNGNNYISPASEPCQANYIVYLTDGEATKDTESNSAIRALPNFASLAGEGCSGNGDGACLGALAEYMFNADLRPNNEVQGQQNVKTYFIGFGPDFSGSASAYQTLQTAATRGGGQAYQADDLSTLSAVFNSIITNILQTSTTFTTPTVAVNAFNRTQTLDDLFVSVFQPNSSAHWPGNLKKYRIDDGIIMDSRNPSQAAVDPNTGFFAEASRSYWSSSADGAAVESGGAASRLPNPANRNLYTYIGVPRPGSTVLLSTHELSTGNNDLDAEQHFALGAPSDPSLEDLVDWARGVDVLNEDGDASTTVRRVMGDPIHSPPAVVIYGGTVASPDMDDAAVFLVTNDGYLHAIDTVSGNELWAFVPQEYLPNLKQLYFNNPVPAKPYTLDGEIRVLKYDVNGDGIVSDDDRVILFFGTGRGGSRYYAIDVTDKNAPRYMWSIGPDELPNVGQTWSIPTIARVNISGATQNSQKLVLVFGGGYDPAQDATVYNSADGVGNRLFMVDAIRGTLLWSAGSSGANLNLSRMTHSIPSEVTVLDTNSDGYADRMYVGDMAAQVWRFDITNGNSANSLVAGGVIASLGTKDDATPVEANARRFYSRADVAGLQRPGAPPILNIAIGSGYRGHPLNTATQDRFYSIRDLQPFVRRTQAQYDSATIIRDADLMDITDDVRAVVPMNAPGWRLMLNLPDWQGEKSLNASNTFDNKIFFTTYTPPTGVSTNTCSATSTGTNRAYVVDAFNGAPIPRRDSPTDPDDGDPGSGSDDDLVPEDRYDDLAQGGIAPEISFLFPEQNKVVCLSGVEVLSVCTTFDSRIKTYWRESNAP